jgi:predicted RNase H-like HicB family nuclease
MSKKIIDKVLSGLSDKERRYSMHRYELIIYWSEEDNAYIAEVPELPGCMADGATYDEALKNVQMIIYEWIETAKDLGREIPQPKGKPIYA